MTTVREQRRAAVDRLLARMYVAHDMTVPVDGKPTAPADAVIAAYESVGPGLDRDELLQALDREWDASCAANRNPLVCETCRTYDTVLDTIDALVDNRAARTASGRVMTDGYYDELVDEAEQGYVPDGRGGLRVPDGDEVERTCNVEHPQARGWHCDVRGPHDTHSATLHGVARYRWTEGG